MTLQNTLTALENAEIQMANKVNAIAEHVSRVGTKTLPGALSRLEEEVRLAQTRLVESGNRVQAMLTALLGGAEEIILALSLPETEALPGPETKKLTRRKS